MLKARKIHRPRSCQIGAPRTTLPCANDIQPRVERVKHFLFRFEVVPQEQVVHRVVRVQVEARGIYNQHPVQSEHVLAEGHVLALYLVDMHVLLQLVFQTARHVDVELHLHGKSQPSVQDQVVDVCVGMSLLFAAAFRVEGPPVAEDAEEVVDGRCSELALKEERAHAASANVPYSSHFGPLAIAQRAAFVCGYSLTRQKTFLQSLKNVAPGR